MQQLRHERQSTSIHHPTLLQGRICGRLLRPMVTGWQSCPFGGCQHALEIALTLVLPMALFESCLISQFSQISKGIRSDFPSVIPPFERRSLNG